MSAVPELHGKRVLLGLSGGVACYKAAELTRELVRAGASVQVVMTEAACRFITPVTMQALSNHPVYTDPWDARADNNMAHINLSRSADAVLIAPASADFIARLVQGLAPGIGFLGAGAIMKREEHRNVHGLTTAATIWMVAALGMAVATDYWAIAIIMTGCSIPHTAR